MKVLNQAFGNGWALYHGDSVEVLKGVPDDSIDFCIYSPPFSSLYTYSNSVHDMGNCRNDDEFFGQYEHLVNELYRVMKPGRNVSVHSMMLPMSKQRDGHIGLKDFPGDIRRCHKKAGFILHSEVTIRKDPVTAMQRTKALGLLHKQVKKDSAMSRQGIPDVLTTFRKPGENAQPIAGRFEYYTGDRANAPHPASTKDGDSINVWQRYAEPTWTDITSRFEEILPTLSPDQAELFFQILNHHPLNKHEIWTDINPSDTLQYQSAKANSDERHICPLQLQVIERALQLWTNPGDVVLDPFNGIGSSGHVALKTSRRYVGIELKESYFNCAVNNLKLAANDDFQQLDILSLAS